MLDFYVRSFSFVFTKKNNMIITHFIPFLFKLLLFTDAETEKEHICAVSKDMLALHGKYKISF